MALRVVTDSTADIPDKVARRLGIVVIPLNLHFGEEILKDGEDIWADEFFHRTAYESMLPYTSQPSPSDFVDIYQRNSQPGDTIISIHLASQLSDTYHNAEQAGKIADRTVIPIDSGLVSMGLGWLVIETGRAVAQGDSVETVLERIQKLRQSVSLYFSVETMENLYRTGRYIQTEKAQYHQRPILSIQRGEIVSVTHLRGSFLKTAEHMLELIRHDMQGQPFRLAFVHANLAGELERIRDMLIKPEDDIREVMVASVGPSVGAHSGAGMFGLIAVPILP